jgi:translation initiation factor 3 subunit B
VDFDDGLDRLIVVDGVPVIDNSKTERLLAKIAKEFTKKGISIKPDDIFVPWDQSTGKSKGCVLQGLSVDAFG